MIDRRTFIGTVAAGLAGLRVRALLGAPAADRLTLGFSTLGCPKWDWITILDFAAAHGYAAIELRGLQGEMDLTRRPEFAPERIAETKRQLAERNLRVVCLGSSARMHDMEPDRRAAQLEEGRRFIDLAQALGAPYVRVFGDRRLPGVPRERMLEHVAAGLRELGAYARERGVTVLLESHGDYTDSATLLELLERANSPSVALLWDAHHTFVAGGERPEETFRRLGRFIRHVHLKDSVPDGRGGRRYVLTGAGEVPVKRQVEVLLEGGYQGVYGFEWEKAWHPTIEEPEVAFAHYAKLMRETFGDAKASGKGA